MQLPVTLDSGPTNTSSSFMPSISPLHILSYCLFACFYIIFPLLPLKRTKNMEVDESFKKPGSIPFKWEVRPGVPKDPPRHQSLPCDDIDHRRSYSLPSTPQNLTPPPSSGSCFTPPPDLRTSSLRSISRLGFERHGYDLPLLARTESVSTRCFLAPWLRRKWGKKRAVSKPKLETEPNYSSDLETLARWSMSTRKSVSPLCDSTSSSAFSSHRSSPRPVSDTEWAGFGLF